MPIGYGQCKGRKYNNQQPIYEKKKPKTNQRRTCSKCGDVKWIDEFATSHFCKACMKEIEAKCIIDRLGGDE